MSYLGLTNVKWSFQCKNFLPLLMEGRDRNGCAPPEGCFPALEARAAAWQDEERREGIGHDRVQIRGDPYPGVHHGNRGRRGCAERDGHGHRASRTLRSGPAPSAPRQGGKGRPSVLLHFDGAADVCRGG